MMFIKTTVTTIAMLCICFNLGVQGDNIRMMDGNGLEMQIQLLEAHKSWEEIDSVHTRTKITKLTIFKAMLESYSSNSTSNISLKNVSYCVADKQPQFRLGRGSLLTYLMRLKICQVASNKTWFEDECHNQTHSLTEYHKAVYLRFCNPTAFEKLCAVSDDNNPTTAMYYWINKYRVTRPRNIFDVLDVTSMNLSFKNTLLEIPLSHCRAIESYFVSILPQQKSKSSGYSTNNLTLELEMPFYKVQYSEWFLVFRPFCQPSACGVSRQNYDSSSFTAYACLPSNCKAPLIVTITIDVLLAILIITANFLVLAVAWRTTVMSNIPGYFKISLAVADMIVGLIVLPGSVYHGIVQNFQPLPFRIEGQVPHATDYFDQRYLDFMGVFTVWSFAVSVYTMGAASIDRFLAVTKPFKYKQGKYLTTKKSIALFIFLWTFGFIISIYPTFSTHSYTLSALGLVLSTGFIAIIIYSITLGLPLLAVWVINLALLGHVCSDKKQRRSMSVSGKRVSVAKEGNQQKSKRSVASISSKRLSTQLNDEVFESDINVINNNETPENKLNNSKPVFYVRETSGSSSQRQSRLTQFTSNMHFKFKNRFSLTSSKSLGNSSNMEGRLAKTLGVMIGAFTLALLPSIIILAIQPALTLYISPRGLPRTFSAEAMNTFTSLEYIATRLFLSNSFWNCIIYSVRNRHFRRAIVDVFICDEDKRRRRRSTIIAHSSSKARRDTNLTKTTSVGSAAGTTRG